MVNGMLNVLQEHIKLLLKKLVLEHIYCKSGVSGCVIPYDWESNKRIKKNNL